MDRALLHSELFHATPYWNFANILKVGIDPKFSRGELPVSWYVDHERVGWAIQHVSKRYNCDVREVIVFEITEQPKALFFIAPMIGVYRTARIIRPSAIYPAYNWFQWEV